MKGIKCTDRGGTGERRMHVERRHKLDEGK